MKECSAPVPKHPVEGTFDSGTSCLPGSSLVRPACRAGRRGLPRPERRSVQRIAHELAGYRETAVVGWQLTYELGSALPNVHSGRMDLPGQQFSRSCLPGRTSRLAATRATFIAANCSRTCRVPPVCCCSVAVDVRAQVRLCRTSIRQNGPTWAAVWYVLPAGQDVAACRDQSDVHRSGLLMNLPGTARLLLFGGS